MAARGPNPWVFALCGLFAFLGLLMLLTSDSLEARLGGAFNVLFFGLGGLAVFLSSRSQGDHVVADTIVHDGRITPALIYPVNLKRSMFGLVGLLVFTASGALMFVYADVLGDDGVIERIIGASCVAIFGSVSVMVLRGLLSGEQYLALTPDGLIQRAAARTFVPWEAMSHVTLVNFMNAKMLGIYLARPELVKNSFVARASRKTNKFFYDVDIALPLQPVDVDPDQFTKLVASLVSDPSLRPTVGAAARSVS